MNSQLKISMLACFSFLIILTSCSTDDINVNDFTDDTLFLMESETRSGKLGCYELVYPVTVAFPDGSTKEVNDSDELKSAVKSWKENNQDVNGRPHLAFPYDILTEDGTLITVENRIQKRKLMIRCKVSMGNGPHGHLGKPCFKIVYPITIVFPDESSLELDSRKALKLALREWRKANPNAEERPSIGYPIEVIFEDETTQTINSVEELKQLKKDCRE